MEGLYQPTIIRDLLERHRFHFSKSLGQNFLINPSVCPRIAEAGVPVGGNVLEIGTGIGVLTHELAKRARKVVALELDERLFPILEETLAEHGNVTVLHQDVLKADLPSICQEHFGGEPVQVCANLPYYITSPILMRLLEERLPIERITVMVQKETAQRLCAKMGERACGAVTFAVSYFSQAKTLFSVSRGSFMPAPNVDSAVIQLTCKKELPAADGEKFLFSLVHAAFSQRRKTLPNPLSGMLGISKEKVCKALTAIGCPTTARAESLTFDQWIALAEALEGEATP